MKRLPILSVLLALAIVTIANDVEDFVNFWLRVNFSAVLAGAMYFMPLAVTG